MRIAVLADIHANLVAFEKVLALVQDLAPDLVMVGGDIINRGPRPRECLELTLDKQQRNGWLVIRGNHEEYVLREAHHDEPRQPWELDLTRHTRWTCGKIPDHLPTLDKMPGLLEWEGPGQTLVRLYHASCKSSRHGLYPQMKDEELLPLLGEKADLVIAGHTHLPFIRQVHNTLFVNAGSVGLPFDGDTRASLALLTWQHQVWKAEIIRIAYDLEKAVQDCVQTGYLHEGSPMTNLILHEIRLARPQLNAWHLKYEKEVSSGRRTMHDSVNEMLALLDART